MLTKAQLHLADVRAQHVLGCMGRASPCQAGMSEAQSASARSPFKRSRAQHMRLCTICPSTLPHITCHCFRCQPPDQVEESTLASYLAELRHTNFRHTSLPCHQKLISTPPCHTVAYKHKKHSQMKQSAGATVHVGDMRVLLFVTTLYTGRTAASKSRSKDHSCDL